MEIIWDTEVQSIEGNGTKVSHLILRNSKTGNTSKLEIGAIFIYVGFHPNSNIFRDEVELDANGYIITDDRMQTSVKGIYACGDVRAQLVRQVTNAVGDGTTAAVAAEKYIETLEDKVAQRV
jgi:thioredoxin reductase (NADPH)